MNGSESLIRTLVNGGVQVCFTNPGTSEMYFVAALDRVPQMRAILGLFEGVCTGAADGYARMAGKPACTLLHLGPGLGNGLANLHNAKRANSPIVNIVGEHATYHLQYDAPLASDIEAIAGAVSGWVRTTTSAANIAADGAAAIAAAMMPPGQVATLILPGDTTWSDGPQPAPAPTLPQPAAVDSDRIEQIASVLRSGQPTIILLGGMTMMEQGLHLASRLSRATGARVMGSRVNGRVQRGAGRAVIERLPYIVPQAVKLLENTAHLILVGAKAPVAFFAYPDSPSWLTPQGCQIHTLAAPEEDGVAALEALAETLEAPAAAAQLHALNRPPLPHGDITVEKVWQAVAALMPEQTIIADEAITSSRNAAEWTGDTPPHDWLHVTGGAIGQGMPVAIGAAVACPERKVLSMQADGAAMYTLQSLWTQAHENLDIVTVLFSNRTYSILEWELKKLDPNGLNGKAGALLKLDNPTLDWVHLAQGMGVNASRATTAEALNQQLQAAIQANGPHLIEVVLPDR